MAKTTIEQLQAELNEKVNQIDALQKDLEKCTAENAKNIEKLLDAEKVLEDKKNELQSANTTIEQLQAELNEKVNVGNKSFENATTQVTSAVLSSSATKDNHNNGLTKVVIKYPDDYKGAKHFKDGDEKYMSKESAALFVGRGIATIVY